MFDALVVKIDLHDVHEVGHLGEDEYSMVELLELGQDPIEDLKLAR